MWKQIEAETAARAVPLTTICMAGILLAFRYDLWSEMIDTNAAYFQVPKSTFITVSFLCILGVMVTALVIWKSIEYYIDYHKAQADYKIVYERERNALIALYEALNGDEWVNKKNWCSDEPINTWKGVKLSPETRQVNKLILPENNLSGYIPEEIGQLVELREIDLRRNKIQGKLPASFIELTNLEGLYLFDNFIEGKIPDELCELPRLCGLYMFNNNFEDSRRSAALFRERLPEDCYVFI